ncbi:hypothetical protein [Mesorhizobium sp. M8A.F.Ca.ET.021.01.1.1]|uniref:hypothetical protein n=1 Tax=Mesorhizobium sp. M8A.F.Ca.ET.021.01.1.1 TaxID=2496757 RepID=UPI000FCC1833|nr:hypothetical protein [Mesorhizobium sp. M8A.F.Ca.ET.021.01.1.1]RUW56836.1 hypothetical protein EOA36_02230 [Mesorhizobium sp. M8A.F.Ca.ET.021.01.1.1]
MTDYPNDTGYYWAKWRIASDDTHEGEEMTPSDTWEIVQINDNNGEPGDLEELSVAVPGVRETQWRDCFIWGPKVSELNPRI